MRVQIKRPWFPKSTMKISDQDVLQFKNQYSDENMIIAGIIKQRLYDKFDEIILDVGAGTGDIAAIALGSKRVVQIDILDYTEYFSSDIHSRLVIDFFDYIPIGQKIGTLFLSHVLQFIDQDVLKLNRKVQELSPKKVITVTNTNDDLMGELLEWIKQNFRSANPESDLPGFPANYKLDDEVGFYGHVRCQDFHLLSEQVGYLMDADPSVVEREALERFLREKLSVPAFTINQKIKVYTRV